MDQKLDPVCVSSNKTTSVKFTNKKLSVLLCLQIALAPVSTTNQGQTPAAHLKRWKRLAWRVESRRRTIFWFPCTKRKRGSYFRQKKRRPSISLHILSISHACGLSKSATAGGYKTPDQLASHYCSCKWECLCKAAVGIIKLIIIASEANKTATLFGSMVSAGWRDF